MEVVTPGDFFARTMGGRPCQMDVTIYAGCCFECACGDSHTFDPSTVRVMRELPGMRLVLGCSTGDAVTCVKIRGLFRYRLESLFGACGEGK